MSEKSLLDIDLNVLKDYSSFEALNKDNWDITSYLNLNYDMNAAIAFSKLYFPDFIEKEGCIILSHRYDEQTFKEWYLHFNGDKKAIESICNSYEIMDYFVNNRSKEEPLNIYNKALDEFAKALKKSWEINCKLLFPNNNIIVEIYDEYDTTRITLYQEL